MKLSVITKHRAPTGTVTALVTVAAMLAPLLSSCSSATHASSTMNGIAHRNKAVWSAPKIREYTIPSRFSSPAGIAVGANGAIWFAESNADKIGVLKTNGAITEFPLSKNSAPWSIAQSTNGDIWFTESSGQANKIGKISPGGILSEYPAQGVYPQGITMGSDGDMWFTESDGNVKGVIGKISPDGAVVTYAIPTINSNPFDIASGRDGSLWFAENSGDKIGKIDESGVITEYGIPTANSAPYGIALGPDGSMWFTESNGNNVGRITPSGHVIEYTVPTSNSKPEEIIAGPGSSMWFTESGGDKVAKIAMNGSITEFELPTKKSFPDGIAADRSGNLWFAESGNNKIAELKATSRALSRSQPLKGKVSRSSTASVAAAEYETTADTKFYPSVSALCAQTVVVARREAAVLSGSTSSIPDAPGVRELASGIHVHVLAEKTMECPNSYGSVTINATRVSITDGSTAMNGNTGYVESADVRKTSFQFQDEAAKNA
jgi:virginiamycin B lyase